MKSDKEKKNAISDKDHKQLWDVGKLSDYFNVPVSKIYSLTRQSGPNAIPRFKIGRHLRFNKESVDLWLASKRIGFGS